MKSSTRNTSHQYSASVLEEERAALDLESLSDDELERLLFEEEPQSESGFWNLPTISGLSLIVVGVAYIFQELGLWNGFDVSVLAEMLPWLAGILIILLGFGVLSWRPKKKKKRKVRRGVDVSSGKEKVVVEEQTKKSSAKKKLTKSRNKKVAGVAGGIADYFSIDPTLVRIAFVIGLIASGGPPLILAYIIMAVVMPDPDKELSEGRVTIIKDS